MEVWTSVVWGEQTGVGEPSVVTDPGGRECSAQEHDAEESGQSSATYKCFYDFPQSTSVELTAQQDGDYQFLWYNCQEGDVTYKIFTTVHALSLEENTMCDAVFLCPLSICGIDVPPE